MHVKPFTHIKVMYGTTLGYWEYMDFVDFHWYHWGLHMYYEGAYTLSGDYQYCWEYIDFVDFYIVLCGTTHGFWDYIDTVNY